MTSMTFLEDFINGPDKRAALPSDPLPPSERDTLLLDPSLFADEDKTEYFEKIGSCGQSCGGCSKRGTPACDDHHPEDGDACGH